MQSRFDRLFEVFVEPFELIDDDAQRERLTRLFGMSRPAVERAVADLMADVLDELNSRLDDAHVDMVFRGAEGGFAFEVKERTPEPSEAADTDEAAPAAGDAEKLT